MASVMDDADDLVEIRSWVHRRLRENPEGQEDRVSGVIDDATA